MVEDGYFVQPAVAAKLEKHFIEARLHTDAPRKNKEQIKELQRTVARKVANPIYVVVDPRTENELGRVEGYFPARLGKLLDLEYSESKG